MLSINTVLLLSLLFIAGTAAATPFITAQNSDQSYEQQDPHGSLFSLRQFAPDSKNNDAQTQIEQASQQFDSFTLQMPLVIKAKFEAFMKHGFRAVLMEDLETKPAEEKMVRSLTDGLRSIGSALEDDMVNYERERKGDGEYTPGFGSEYHNSSPPSRSSHNIGR
jgi:hypothetical protein